jgi:hypothetical protein
MTVYLVFWRVPINALRPQGIYETRALAEAAVKELRELGERDVDWREWPVEEVRG